MEKKVIEHKKNRKYLFLLRTSFLRAIVKEGYDVIEAYYFSLELISSYFLFLFFFGKSIGPFSGKKHAASGRPVHAAEARAVSRPASPFTFLGKQNLAACKDTRERGSHHA